LTSASPGLDRGCPQRPPTGEVVISMRPVCVFANGPAREAERLRAGLRGQWRQAARAGDGAAAVDPPPWHTEAMRGDAAVTGVAHSGDRQKGWLVRPAC
jgi:hypothetical protein